MDQECYIGGIAVDVLRHGVRFPLLAYAPNEYDNGSFFSGLLAAASFSLLGRNVLALKLVTHTVVVAGALAALWLLRGCLDELGLTSRRARWAAVAVLLIALALAPRVVTLTAMYAVGNHAEGAAIDVILLALFSRRIHSRSSAGTAAFWALVGFALYLNKGTLLVLPVLGAAEVALAWHARRRIAAALGGLALGALPEILVVAGRHGMGWAMMASKAEDKARAFPWAFLDSIASLAEYRIELLACWALALMAAALWLARPARRVDRSAPVGRLGWPGGAPPVTLLMVLGFTLLHLAALTVMAQGGVDPYAIYGYPTLSVLVAVVVAALCARAGERWGAGAATGAAAAAMALALFLYRPDAMAWTPGAAARLWRDSMAAACSWRFAEGFEREQQYGLAPPGSTREQHAIARCRSLSDADQALDCIGGIAREINWRRGGRIDGAPPPDLGPAEARAYAYHYGTHRGGDGAACAEFEDPALAAECTAAVALECLVVGDIVTRYATSRGFARPACAIPEPPMQTYWAAMRASLLSRPAGANPDRPAALGDNDLRACQRVYDACYPPAADRSAAPAPG